MLLRERIERHKENGGHWFGYDEMCFFKTRIHDDLGDGYFITSEDNDLGDGRKFTIRHFKADDCLDIEDIGGFYTYVSAEAARKAYKVYRRFDEMRKGAGYRENAILDDHKKIVPFKANRPHQCFTIIANNGDSCVYDFHEGRFVG